MIAREVARDRVVTRTARTGRIPRDVLRIVVREETFGERLRRMRLAAGLSLRGLAARISADHTLVCHFESGAKQPSVDSLVLMADALDTTMDYLFRGRGEP